jgi:hypothetical protein
MPAKPADTDPLPGAPAGHAGADCVDHPGDLVPGDAREGEAGPLPVDGETVAVAHAARLDADADLTPRRLGHVALDEFKRAAAPRHLHRRIFAIAASWLGRTSRFHHLPRTLASGAEPPIALIASDDSRLGQNALHDPSHSSGKRLWPQAQGPR